IRPHGLPPGDEERAGAKRMDPHVRGAMLELLWSAANEGSGRGARLATRTYGKTGTSQDSRDAYFIGFSGDLVTGVWIGHDDNRPMSGMQGGGAPAALFRTFMTRALAPAGEPAAPAPQRDLPPERGERGPPPVIREYDVEDEPLSEEEWWAGQAEQEGPAADAPVIVDVPEPEVPVRPPPRVAPPPVGVAEDASPPEPADAD